MNEAHARVLVGLIRELASSSGSNSAFTSTGVASWTDAQWRDAIVSLPVDARAFRATFGDLTEFIDGLRTWCLLHIQLEGHRREFGFLGVILLNLLTVAEAAVGNDTADRSGVQENNTRPASNKLHKCDQVCIPLVRNDSVISAVECLYSPDYDVDLPGLAPHRVAVTRSEWSQVRFADLEFHRHGTTSFILSGPAAEVHGMSVGVAVKCVLLPYTRLSAIEASTRKYADDFRIPGPSNYLVKVWASWSSCILMDFVPGRTLAEYLSDEIARPDDGLISNTGDLRVDLLGKLGPPICDALSELRMYGKHHEDLSPTNILVPDLQLQSSGTLTLKLIDLGRNYLYTRAITGVEAGESAYVAPEIRDDLQNAPDADLYSLGRLLIWMGNVGQNKDGTIPDSFYANAPMVARFIEDLVDVDPRKRLAIFNEAREGNRYIQLKKILSEEVEAVNSLAGDPLPRRALARRLYAAWKQILPVADVVNKQWKVLQVRRVQGVFADSRRSLYARYLLTFAVICAISWYVTGGLVVAWTLRDFGIGVAPRQVEIAQIIRNEDPNVIPILDDLRAPGYRIGDLENNLPARIVCLSGVLISTRFYQNIFGGLTTLFAFRYPRKLRWWAYVTEFSTRMFSFWWAFVILALTLIQPRWWPVGTAIVLTGVWLTTATSASFAKSAMRLAHDSGLSTVPPRHQRINGLRMFEQWVPSMGVFVLAVWILAILIQAGALQDVIVYATIMSTVNIGLFYSIKTGIDAPDVRGGLTRCFLAAERLHYLERNERDTAP